MLAAGYGCGEGRAKDRRGGWRKGECEELNEEGGRGGRGKEELRKGKEGGRGKRKGERGRRDQKEGQDNHYVVILLPLRCLYTYLEPRHWAQWKH